MAEQFDNNRAIEADLAADHLCYLVSQGFDLTDRREYEDLVRYPQFRCNHCGRHARHEANVCVPMRL